MQSAEKCSAQTGHNKSDRIDALKLAALLRGNYLKSVYHSETGVRTLRELARSYLATTKDLTRVMSRPPQPRRPPLEYNLRSLPPTR